MDVLGERVTTDARGRVKQARKRKCKQCCEWFQPRSSFARACSPECAIAEARDQRERHERKWRQQRKQELKPLTKLCSETQVHVNRYVRLRDQDKGCISCDSPNISDAGHFISVGSKYRTSRIRFDVRQINGQCGHCNRYKGGGNQLGYIEGIKARYGEQRLQLIQDLRRMADQGALPPLTKDEVREIGAEYRRKARELEKCCVQ